MEEALFINPLPNLWDGTEIWLLNSSTEGPSMHACMSVCFSGIAPGLRHCGHQTVLMWLSSGGEETL